MCQVSGFKMSNIRYAGPSIEVKWNRDWNIRQTDSVKNGGLKKSMLFYYLLRLTHCFNHNWNNWHWPISTFLISNSLTHILSGYAFSVYSTSAQIRRQIERWLDTLRKILIRKKNGFRQPKQNWKLFRPGEIDQTVFRKSWEVIYSKVTKCWLLNAQHVV